MQEQLSKPDLQRAVLCYATDYWAYFTTQALDRQWGDDWEDVPYECNAGIPYAWSPDYDGKAGRPEWHIVKVGWDGPFCLPAEEHFSSPFSVRSINAGAVPWLRPFPHYTTAHSVTVPAGTRLSQFIEAVEGAGGTVYLPSGMGYPRSEREWWSSPLPPPGPPRPVTKT